MTRTEEGREPRAPIPARTGYSPKAPPLPVVRKGRLNPDTRLLHILKPLVVAAVATAAALPTYQQKRTEADPGRKRWH